MEDGLSAAVPRHLRVRASLQIAGTRLPARLVLLAMGMLFGTGMAVVAGQPVEQAGQLGIAGLAIGALILEGDWWGYSTRRIVVIALAHLTRSRYLMLTPVEYVLTAETSAPPQRTVRWQAQENE